MEEKEINLWEYALQYVSYGFNVSCITNITNDYNSQARSIFKAPSHKWKHLFMQLQSSSEAVSYDWENSVGIGTFTSWKKLRVIDLDGCPNLSFAKKILKDLGLPENYEWLVESGSKNGYHIYYLGNRLEILKNSDVVSTYPPKEEFEGEFEKLEFLWYTHTVLPPSIHGAGHRYKFINESMPKNTPSEISNEKIIELINKYLDFKKVEVGNEYGEVFEKINPTEDFVNDTDNIDVSKYLVDSIYCIVDIKTSGFVHNSGSEKKYPEILQLAWILTNDKGIVLKKKSFLIDSSYFDTKKNDGFINVDFEVASEIGIPIENVLTKFISDLKISDFVVGHNLDFSIEILEYYFIKIFNGNPFKNKNRICTMHKGTSFCQIMSSAQNGFKYPKLTELYEKLFQTEIIKSLNSEVDCIRILKCFKKMKRLKII